MGVLCGGIFSIQPGACETVGLAGDFHRPYETPKILAFTIQRTTLPQLRCAQQLPQRGSREGLFHSTGYSLNRNVAGDFHRPYETQKFLHSAIHRGTLPQLRCAQQLPQGGSRERVSPCVVLLSGWGVRAGCIGWRLRCRVPGGGPFVPGGG